MPVTFQCPTCGARLQVPNLTGKMVRCPGCGAIGAIKPAAGPVMVGPDQQLCDPRDGRLTSERPAPYPNVAPGFGYAQAAGRHEFDRALGERQRLYERLTALEWAMGRSVPKSRYVSAARRLRGVATQSGAGNAAVVLAAGTVAFGLIAFCLILLGASPKATIAGSAYGFLLAVGVASCLLWLPGEAGLNAAAARRELLLKEYHATQEAYRAAAAECDRMKQLARIEEERRVREGKRHRLLTADWRLMAGIPFEDFLGEVFELLGYRVEKTKVTGDQGVDLIVHGLGRKVAVQAKGWKNSVGNKAVQAVFAGKLYYGCDVCAVITNSTFTSGARDLAPSTGCLLIDGGRIDDLINGRLPAFPPTPLADSSLADDVALLDQ